MTYKRNLKNIQFNASRNYLAEFCSPIKAIGEQNRRLRTPIESIYDFYYFSNRVKALNIDFTTVLWYNKHNI